MDYGRVDTEEEYAARARLWRDFDVEEDALLATFTFRGWAFALEVFIRLAGFATTFSFHTIILVLGAWGIRLETPAWLYVGSSSLQPYWTNLLCSGSIAASFILIALAPRIRQAWARGDRQRLDKDYPFLRIVLVQVALVIESISIALTLINCFDLSSWRLAAALSYAATTLVLLVHRVRRTRIAFDCIASILQDDLHRQNARTLFSIPPGSVLLVARFQQHEDDKKEQQITIFDPELVHTGSAALILQVAYRAYGDSSNNSAALKVFRSGLSDFNKELLRREIRTCSRLQHPNVLPFLGTSVFRGHTILVARYMKNGTLLDFLKLYPGSNRSSFILQVAEAVRYLHEDISYVHGDLKCQNVLVSDDGRALLADFGLSGPVNEQAPASLRGIRMKNTLQFAAPELLIDETSAERSSRLSFDDEVPLRMLKSKSFASDIYAFAMLTLQAYIGGQPWGDVSYLHVLLRVREGRVPLRPGDAAAAVGFTEDHWRLCLACWDLEPARRPHIRAVLSVLSSFGQGSSLIIVDTV